MNASRLKPFIGTLAALSLCSIGADTTNTADPDSTDTAERLLVMLQSDDMAAVEASLLRHGADISHRLPIIGAFGAHMTRAQLERVTAEIPENTRIIDDLAWEPEPLLQPPDECPLAASIELVWNARQASWILYNKGDEALVISEVVGSWPQSWGAPASVKAGDITLKAGEAQQAPASQDTPETATRIGFTGADTVAIPAKSQLSVQFEFAIAPDSPQALQRSIDLQAIVNDECRAKLAPSYSHPDADTYYPSVSGASLLHRHGVTGKGVTVAVLDSGLWEHPELTVNTRGEPRILARYDAIEGQEVEEAFDASGHGTHMTSVLARSGQSRRKTTGAPSYLGVAPDVDLVTIKAFGEDGEAGFLDLVRGIQWVFDNKERFGIRVLNLSFAARPRWPYWDDPVNQALMRVWHAGIFIAAAAGNEGPEPMTVGSPGNLPYLMTVGAFTDSWTEDERLDDYIPDFSSRGPSPMGHIKPDVVAPGGHMAGITRPGSTLTKRHPEYQTSYGEFVMTGTSQATALVSGLAALMLQLEPSLRNDELKCLLSSSAEPAIDLDGRLSYSPFVQGAGRVSIQRALTLGDRICEQQTMDIVADLKGLDHFRGPAIFEGEVPTLPGQMKLISTDSGEEGPSDGRRWGAKAHLSRLQAAPTDSPIDWIAIFNEEERRISVEVSE